jgi:agmatine deiminase
LETDGRGRLLTTPGCLLSETRNPGWTQQQVAEELHAKLAVTEILWLDGGGLDGDDTDGHIDQLARFVSPSDVVCAVCNDPHDANHHPLQQNYLQLRVWGRQTEPAVEIHRLPIPPRREIDGQPVPESYCNFLMVDRRRLLLPQFGDETSDRAAAELFARLLPEWKIFPLDARVLVWGLGAFHCASQQQPAPQQLQLRGVPQANNAPRGGDPD